MIKGLSISGTITIYVFTSNARNYSDGEYYFVANGKEEAENMAIKYQRGYNDRLLESIKYALAGNPFSSLCLEFNLRDVRDFELPISSGPAIPHPGFLPFKKNPKKG